MADQPPVPAGTADPQSPDRAAPTAGTRDPGEATGGTPRWVKVFGIIGVVLVLLIVVMLLTGHGPGRHMHSGLGSLPPAAAGITRETVATIGGHPA